MLREFYFEVITWQFDINRTNLCSSKKSYMQYYVKSFKITSYCKNALDWSEKKNIYQYSSTMPDIQPASPQERKVIKQCASVRIGVIEYLRTLFNTYLCFLRAACNAVFLVSIIFTGRFLVSIFAPRPRLGCRSLSTSQNWKIETKQKIWSCTQSHYLFIHRLLGR